MKKTISILLAAVVTVAALVYAFWDVDIPRLLALLSKGNYLMGIPFAGLLIFYFLFTALRWRLILRPLGRYSLGEVTPAMMIGFAGNNLLPAHLGELVRTVVFATRFKVPKSSVLMTLVIERLFDVFAILAIFLVAVFSIDEFPESVRTGSYATAGVFAGACIGVGLFLRFPDFFFSLVERLEGWLPAGLQRKIMQMLTGFLHGLSSVKSLKLVIFMLGYSLMKWAASGGTVWITLWGYGADVPPGASMIVIAVTALAVTLPGAPGFFGSIQAAFVFALTPFGVAREVALAASIFFLLAQWVPITLVGAFFFATTRSSLGDLQKQVAELKEEKEAQAEGRA